MPRTHQQVGGCAPSQQEDVYIYAIAPVANRGLAAITSADELIVLNMDRLNDTDTAKFPSAISGITSLAVADQGNSVICAGSSGTVAVFDLRAGSRSTEFKSGLPDWAPITES